MCEEREGDGFAYCAVACGVGVEVVAAVVDGEQAIEMVGVADDFVEVEGRVEVAGGENPGVDGLAIGFGGWAGVVVIGADEGGDSGADHLDAVGVGAVDDLLIGGEDARDESGVFCGGNFAEAREATEVVDGFEDDEPADAGLRDHVAIEASERVGAEAVGEEVVAADALVEDPDIVRGRRGLEALGEDVGPAVVAVGGGGVAVGDGVAEGNDGSCAGGGEDVDAGELIPVLDLLCVGKIACGDEIAVKVVRGGAGAGVAGFTCGRRVKVNSDGEVRERGDGIVDGVGDVFGAGGDDDFGGSAEGEGLVGGGIDGGGGGRERAGDVDGGEVQRVDAEGVGEMHAQGCATGGDADDLAESRVAKVVGGEGILRLGNLLRGGPGADPELRIRGGLGLGWRAGNRCGEKEDDGREDFCWLHLE